MSRTTTTQDNGRHAYAAEANIAMLNTVQQNAINRHSIIIASTLTTSTVQAANQRHAVYPNSTYAYLTRVAPTPYTQESGGENDADNLHDELATSDSYAHAFESFIMMDHIRVLFHSFSLPHFSWDVGTVFSRDHCRIITYPGSTLRPSIQSMITYVGSQPLLTAPG